MSDTSPHSSRLRRISIFILAVAAISLAPWVYQTVKKQRAARLAAKSIELAAADQPEPARAAAEAAFNLAPDSPASLRARARSAKTPTDAFFFSSALLNSGAAEPADLRHYLETCLALNFAANLDLQLQHLLEAEPSNIDNWLLAGKIHLLRDQAQVALHCAGQALALDGDSRAARLLTAEIAMRSSEETFRNAGASTLGKLIAEDSTDAHALQAQIDLLPNSASDLIAHPLANAGQRLLAANHLLATASGDATREQIISATIERHKETELAPLLHWLNRNQLAQRSLELVNYESARVSTELFTVWCHAMNTAGRAAELVELIEDPRKRSQIPLRAEALELVLVDAYEASANPAFAEIHWKKVLRAARSGNRQGKLLKLAQWAERHGYADRAISLYRELLSESPNYTPHWYDRIAELARQSDQLPLLREITSELHADVPENIVYQHNLAYLSALAGEGLDEAAVILNSLIDRAPEASSARCALALLESKRGNFAAARTQLQQIDPEGLDPTSNYIYQTLNGNVVPAPPSITPYELAALRPIATGG